MSVPWRRVRSHCVLSQSPSKSTHTHARAHADKCTSVSTHTREARNDVKQLPEPVEREREEERVRNPSSMGTTDSWCVRVCVCASARGREVESMGFAERVDIMIDEPEMLAYSTTCRAVH